MCMFRLHWFACHQLSSMRLLDNTSPNMNHPIILGKQNISYCVAVLSSTDCAYLLGARGRLSASFSKGSCWSGLGILLEYLPLENLQYCPTGRTPQGKSRTLWSNYTAWLISLWNRSTWRRGRYCSSEMFGSNILNLFHTGANEHA